MKLLLLQARMKKAFALLLATASLIWLPVVDAADFDFNNMMGKDCPNFRCSAGMTPVPKSRPKFDSMGCSSMGGSGSMILKPGENNAKPYESCCHQWNACYQICGISKKVCDTEFEECSKKSCGADSSCTKDLELNSMMMKLSGCKRYDDAQLRACECAPNKQAQTKREAAIRYFYKKQSPENADKASDLAAKADTPSKLGGLFRKLLLKYPDAIEIKEDPMQAMFDKIHRERESGSTEQAETPGEVEQEGAGEEDDASEEHIEL